MNLYVGNIPHATTEEALKSYFETCGAVNSVRIIKDRETGKSRGFAFVTMANEDDNQMVIDSLNGKLFEGRPLRISIAEERAPRPAGERRSFGAPRSFEDRDSGFGGGFGERRGGDRRGGNGFGGGRSRRSF